MHKIQAGKVIEFFKMLNAFQRVYRVGYVPGEDRKENDVEHSYTLGLLAWYIIEAFDLKLDKDKALRYALVHDLVEVYAGDTHAFSKNAGHLNSQKEREAAAQKRLAAEFPEVKSIHDHIEAYEARQDPESVFVHALDKVHPVLIEILQDGRTVKEEKLGYTEAVSLKRRVTAASPEIKDLLEQLIAILDKDKKLYFGELTD